MDVGPLAKAAARAGRRLSSALADMLEMMLPLVAVMGCMLMGWLVFQSLLPTSQPTWMRRVTRWWRAMRPHGYDMPPTSMDDLLDKMCELHAEVKRMATKDAVQDKFDEILEAIVSKLDGMENSLQGSHDLRIQKVSAAIAKLHERLDVVHAGLVKAVATLIKENHKEVKTDNKGALDEMTTTILGKLDKILKEVQEALMDANKTYTQSLLPLKRSQENMSTSLNEKTTEVLKEISNVFHRVKKEGGDLMAMVRWSGSKIEQVEKDCAHQPDRLQILRDTLMEIQTTVVRIQTEMESDHGGDGDGIHASPQHKDWPREPPSAPTPGPQTINLEETVPNVQLMRPGPSAPLTSLTLADGRTIYVPRQVVSNLFGTTF